jgi:hypothetical protein
MILQSLLHRFEREAPICLMLRLAMEHILSPERVDGVFEELDHAQAEDGLRFSLVANIMGLVAARMRPSVHAGYQADIERVGVTAKAVYDKLQRVKPRVSQGLVRQTAVEMSALVDQLGAALPRLAAGYQVKILDGNHLRRTQRRLGVLRELNVAPLPGHALAVLDPSRKLILDVFPCEDAHAQERTLLPAVLETVQPRDLWIADRNFCTTDFLLGIADRKAAFVIRQHGSSLRGECSGRRLRKGRCATGAVYEQAMTIIAKDGRSLPIRRVTLRLDHGTRDGDREMHILTNLPERFSAQAVARLYRNRWKIETAFAEVAKNLEGEIETLGYPRAALFAFSMALVVHNLLSVIQAALRAAHGAKKVEGEVSSYYLADEISHAYRGLCIAVPAASWTKHYGRLSRAALAKELLRIAREIRLTRYRKHPRGPRKPVQPMNKKHRTHASTARLLNTS